MTHNIRRRLTSDTRAEGGFTLIEIMVVVLVISILVAVAMPQLLGNKEKAAKSAALANLKQAAQQAVNIIDESDQSYVAADVPTLTAAEKNLVFQTAATEEPNEVSIAATVAAGGRWVGAVRDDAGKCHYVALSPTEGAVFASPGVAAATCSPAGAPAQGDPAWQKNGSA